MAVSFKRAPRRDQVYADLLEGDRLPDHSDFPVDYVLVYNNKFVNSNVSYRNKCDVFLNNLLDEGFLMEKVPFSVDPNVTFVKLHLPEAKAADKAKQLDLELQCDNYNYRPQYRKPIFKFFGNELLYVRPGTKLFERIRSDTYEALFPVKKISTNLSELSLVVKEVTQVEKLVIITEILALVAYGSSRGQVGVQKLKQQGVITSHFPVHQGTEKWPSTGMLNDRQLLFKYWANLKCLLQLQPIGLVEKYYGPEIAFYFAWVHLYTRMLIPVSILSFVLTIPGLFVFSDYYMEQRVKDFCYSDKLVCPSCDFRYCKVALMSNSCTNAKISFILDNKFTVSFSIIISLWSTLVVILWKRTEALHVLQWNLHRVADDTNMRPDYAGQSSLTAINPITEESEPLVPMPKVFLRYTVSLITMLLLASTMVTAIFCVMILRRFIVYKLRSAKTQTIFTQHASIIASLGGAIVSMVFLLVFQAFYTKLATALTNLENPRTQHEYDKSFVLKMFALAFVNNFAPILYVALMKGKFYTHPGDLELYKIFDMGADICDPVGCIPDLAIQLALILFGKKLPMLFQQITILRLKMFLKKRAFKISLDKDAPQWEQDYMLVEPHHRYHLVGEYTEMIIQYGFVVFFISAFPIAPILALVNNLIENRVDAMKLVVAHRRLIPRRVAGLEVWYDILKFMTFFGILSNALIMAFTSDFVNRELYKWRNKNSYDGYVDTTLTEFKIDDFYDLVGGKREEGPAFCYYKAMHYPHDHPKKYTKRHDYWEKIAKEFMTVVSLEHIILVFCGILAYALPSIPYSVKTAIGAQEEHIRDIQMRSLSNTDEAASKLDKFRSYSFTS